MAVLETAVQTIMPTELLPFSRYGNYLFCTWATPEFLAHPLFRQ
jgi:hypothetical protein